MKQADDGPELLMVAGGFDGHFRGAHVDDLAAEDIHGAQDFAAHGAFRLDLHEHHLAFNGRNILELGNLDDGDELVQLLRDLLKNRLVTEGGDGHMAGALFEGRSHVQGMNIVSGKFQPISMGSGKETYLWNF